MRLLDRSWDDLEVAYGVKWRLGGICGVVGGGWRGSDLGRGFLCGDTDIGCRR